MKTLAAALTLGILLVLVSAFAPIADTAAAGKSPFVGAWRAIDGDGSDIRVAIAGPPGGPFRITWTESYFSGCGGEAGIVRGTGSLRPGDPGVLEADLHFKCFRTGVVMDFHMTWVYHPDLNVLSSQDETGVVTIWTRPDQPLVPPMYARIFASAAGDWFWTTGFSPNSLLAISIFEAPGGSLLWEGTKAVDETGFVNVDPQEHEKDLLPGYYLVIRDGFGQKSLVLETITIDVFDVEQDLMAGTAPADRFVLVVAADSPDPADQTAIETTSGPLGAWSADFDVDIGDTDEWRAWSFAQIFDDDGDANEASPPPPPPNPRFSVFPEWEYIEGWQWADGAAVSASVAGKAECYADGISGHPEWDPRELFVSMTFPEGCDVAAGDEITLTGNGTTRTHIVQNLAVTSVDVATDVVAGTADSGAEVHTWVHGFGELDMRVSVEGGAWEAAFGSIPFDLLPGMCGRSEILDAEGNATAVDWCAPNTRLTIFLDRPYIEGYEWPDGATVTVTVGKGVCTSSALSGYPEWDPQHTFLSIDFPEGCDVGPGDDVTMSDGALAISHIVQNLEVTSVDLQANTVAGMADEGAVVYVWAHGVDGSEIQRTADDGTWLADFNSIGFVLQEGMCGRAEIRVGANATGWDWCTPAPPPPQEDL